MFNSNSEALKAGVASKQYPQHLYRFRQLDDNFNGILENNAMWFSNPNGFNDPFDCKVNLEDEYEKEYVISWLQKNGMSLAYATHHQSILSKEEWKRIVESRLESVMANSYICCFAEEKENLLMWSHYTGSHQGVCLKFDITVDPDFFITPVRVNYTEIYPKENYIKDSGKTIMSILTSKSIHWKYEKEIRVVKPVAEENKFFFKKEALVEIIFGCKTELSKIEEIKNLAQECGYHHLKFSKAELDSNEYKLNFKTI
ncbi:hypothetical protein D3C87_277530 [compost metagenome]